MGDLDATATLGVEARGYRRGASSTDSWDQYVIPVRDQIVSFAGRATSFRTPGTGTAASQNLGAIHNATGSAVLVSLKQVIVSMTSTAAKVIAPPVVRLYRITVVPTAGSALNKVGLDTTQTSSASVTVWGAASADGTAAALTLTVPTTTRIAQAQAPRALTLVGMDEMQPMRFLEGDTEVTLRALEGVALVVENVAAVGTNPTTDLWTVAWEWTEYTRP